MTTNDKKTLDPRIEAIGKKLRQLRIDAGYTSYETFAFENNIARKQYWRLEKGANFNIETLLKILDIHKISLTEFFNEE